MRSIRGTFLVSIHNIDSFDKIYWQLLRLELSSFYDKTNNRNPYLLQIMHFNNPLGCVNLDLWISNLHCIDFVHFCHIFICCHTYLRTNFDKIRLNLISICNFRKYSFALTSMRSNDHIWFIPKIYYNVFQFANLFRKCK